MLLGMLMSLSGSDSLDHCRKYTHTHTHTRTHTHAYTQDTEEALRKELSLLGQAEYTDLSAPSLEVSSLGTR